MVDIHDKLKGAESIACGINSSGQVIGQYITEDNQSRAFVWDESKGFRDLKIVSDREWGCSPLSITDRGQGIVGTHEKRVKRFGFVLNPGGYLSFLLDRRFKRLRMDKALPFETNHFTAYDINNKGQIIICALVSRTTKWYLMTPAAAGN